MLSPHRHRFIFLLFYISYLCGTHLKDVLYLRISENSVADIKIGVYFAWSIPCPCPCIYMYHVYDYVRTYKCAKHRENLCDRDVEVIKPKIKHSMCLCLCQKSSTHYINLRTLYTITSQATEINWYHHVSWRQESDVLMDAYNFSIKTNYYFIGNEQKDTIHYKWNAWLLRKQKHLYVSNRDI